MKYLLCLILILTALVSPLNLTASDTSLANYEATVTISNNSTAATNVAVPFTLSVPNMVAAGYIDTACTRVAMTDTDDVIFMPGYAANPWMVFVPSIGANASVRDSLFTANTSMSSKKYWFPGNAGGQIADGTLELGTTYSVLIAGYVDTIWSGANEILWSKPSSAVLYVSANNTITYLVIGGPTLTATVTSGYHKFNSTGTGANTKLYVDDALIDTDVAYSCANTADNWYVGGYSSGNTPFVYFDYFSANITATPRCNITEWAYGTTFDDSTADNNDLINVTFRTTTTDADVSATISSFVALDTATAPSYTVTEQIAFYTGNITASGNFTSNLTSSGGPAVLDIVDDMSSAGAIPPPFLWGIIGCFGFAATGLALSYARRKFAIGGGYVTTMLIVGILIFGLLTAFGKFDWWMLWFYIIIAGGLAMASRHQDWGGSISHHGLIGFLAMSFTGLTLINRILEGAFITAAETSHLNTVAFTKAFSLLNLFTIPIMNWDFFTVGIASLIRWDYSYFGGQAQIIAFLLYSVTAVVSFVIFTYTLGLVYSAITRST